jgi:hypothetical protein
MNAYRVMHGKFNWEGTPVAAGDVVRSNKPLDTMFKGKFERVESASPGQPPSAPHVGPAGEPVGGPKKKG